MKNQLLRDGKAHRLLWGADPTGRFRAKEFFDGLDMADQAKFEPWFDRVAETGSVKNKEKFDEASGDVFVFSAAKNRIACFFDCRDIVLICGFSARTLRGRGPSRAFDDAARLRDAYLNAT